MALTTRTEPRLELAKIEPGLPGQGEGSMAELATRLAQESVSLAVVEVRRFVVELRERQRSAVRAAVALFLGAGLGLLSIATLTVGVILYLGSVWNYAAGALVTGGALLLMTLVALAIARAAGRSVAGPREPAGDDRDERSPSHGT